MSGVYSGPIAKVEPSPLVDWLPESVSLSFAVPPECWAQLCAMTDNMWRDRRRVKREMRKAALAARKLNRNVTK